MSTSDDDSDVLQLSAEAQRALKEFYEEQNEKLLSQCDDKDATDVKFDEDWQLSQFWYDEKTCERIVECAFKKVGSNGSIALISCPTLYKTLKKKSPTMLIKLFEFDKRFSVYGSDYVFYDYNEPMKFDEELLNSFDLVVVDPPFLSEECLTKSLQTTKSLTKQHVILCTGEIMEELATKLLNVHKCSFEPKHNNNLANQFACFTNFSSELD
ncbi:PREDICTED: protein-lysine N-methyltransferase n6amt2 [Diuraphis noxia]|uniref:protein-lysine N-methyltransferase n6amt2 n=1 Tax=Diuraphis noxia TaxID=143948 RepID=UPI0007636CBE|nr:PREDICTED: protein-lysine N-methyltransferase n6amt2 [Diuraphis noxia]